MSALMLNAIDRMKVSVFYKERKPSLKVLEKVKPIMNDFVEKYEVTYYNIEDEKNAEMIKELGLPGTHFPFAVVVEGKFTAKIGDDVVSFVEFPKFMHGIGRHEGNWSLEQLVFILEGETGWMEKNILPEHEDEHDDHGDSKGEE